MAKRRVKSTDRGMRGRGYERYESISVEEQLNRELPNSDTSDEDNWTYQDQPWQKRSPW